MSERADKVACALHGKRPAGDSEMRCMDCGTVVCAVCNNGDRCPVCYEEYQVQAYEYDTEYQNWLDEREKERQYLEEEAQREHEERKRLENRYADIDLWESRR